MTPQEQTFLDERGYLVLKGVFSAEDADAMYRRSMELCDQERAAGQALYLDGKAQRVWNLVDKDPIFEEAIQTPCILEAQEYLLGSDCILSSFTVNRIGPGAAGYVHIDYPLGSLPEPLPSFAFCANSVYLLTDFTEENGATQVVPGSHKRGRGPRPGESTDDSIHITGRKGDVVIVHGTLWHGNSENRSDEDRVGLLGFFCRAFMKPQRDHVKLVSQEVKDRATPTMRRLLELDR